MYENQADKMRKELATLQARNLDLEEQVATLEAENFAISNGKLQVTESTYFKKGDGLLNIKIKDLEEANTQLQENLSRNAKDFKDLLAELDSIKHEVQQKDDHIKHLENEMRLRPNLA